MRSDRALLPGVKVEIHLNMGAKFYPSTFSRNVIGDITGKTSPQEYVTISGHIDSWDVGQVRSLIGTFCAILKNFIGGFG